MSLVEAFKAKPVVVQRLSFIWCLSAFSAPSYSIASGLMQADWSALPRSFFAGAMILWLSWGHFRQSSVAWWLGLGAICVRTRSGVSKLPDWFGHFKNLTATINADPTLASAPDVSWQRLTVVGICVMLTGLLLAAIAMVLALSPSGRAAYSIKMPQKGVPPQSAFWKIALRDIRRQKRPDDEPSSKPPTFWV